jgi:hypothetical protein
VQPLDNDVLIVLVHGAASQRLCWNLPAGGSSGVPW